MTTPPFGKACLPAGRGGWERFKELFSNVCDIDY
jgi:hypothetical protein